MTSPRWRTHFDIGADKHKTVVLRGHSTASFMVAYHWPYDP